MTRRIPPGRQALASEPYRSAGDGPDVETVRARERKPERDTRSNEERLRDEAHGMRKIADRRGKETKALRAQLAALRECCLATFQGGCKSDAELEIFRHGMETVCNVIDGILRGDDTNVGIVQMKRGGDQTP